VLPVAWSVLSRHRDADRPAAPAPVLAPARRQAKVEDLQAAVPPPVDPAAEAAAALAAAEQAAADQAAADDDDEDEADAKDEAPADAPMSPEAEKSKVYLMMFMSKALEDLKAVRPNLDNYNKFGINLFLAGACEAMSDVRRVDPADAQRILSAGLQVVGTRKEQAETFAQKCEDYLLADSRYAHIYESGRNAMNT